MVLDPLADADAAMSTAATLWAAVPVTFLLTIFTNSFRVKICKP